MNRVSSRLRAVCGWLFVALLMIAAITPADAGMLVETSSAPFGVYGGIEYERHAGRFVGATSKGEFRVPFEIVAPADPVQGNGIVVFEAPHFFLGTFGRDGTLGGDVLFKRRFSHASVGFSNEGFNLRNPFVGDAVIAGEPVIANNPPFPRDVEILAQFVEALSEDPIAFAILGQVQRRYAYGISQSAEALYELFYGGTGAGPFDLTVLHVPLWRPAFARPDVLASLPETFVPLADIGKVMLVSAEGDLLISGSMQLRNAVADPNYRVYEVAGAPHFPLDIVINGDRTNPLDVSPMVRAAFVAGHRWVERGIRPPASRLLDAAAAGEIDPVYLTITGIGRDQNGNAAGGVRLPDVASGRAFHLASVLQFEVLPGLPGLVGLWFDLACAPAPGSGSPEPRFANHGDYVRSVAGQTLTLLRNGYLLPADAAALVRRAAESSVGKPGACDIAP